ncbi:MAG: GtrA family protein, partial [Bdellovibrionia bacterium]
MAFVRSFKLDPQYFRSAGVGLVATAVGLGSLEVMVDLFHFTPEQVNLPTLFFGTLVQFIGHRYFVFQAFHAQVLSQMLSFAVVETVAFFLNALLFQFLVAQGGIHFITARLLGS